MQFKKTYDSSKAGGTSLQGYVTTTYENLVACFGDPTDGPNSDIDGKVTCEWIIEFEDGTITTVYDWKTYSGTPMGRYQWHIGGVNRRAEKLIQEALDGQHSRVKKFESSAEPWSD